MQALANGLSMILSKLAAAVAWIGKLFVAVFKAAWDLLTDLFVWSFDSVLGLASSALTAIDVSGMTSAGQWWGTMPAEIMNMLGLTGFGIAMGIIVSAIGIRLVLQLIPFTRLGS
jgi:hypothetical protein